MQYKKKLYLSAVSISIVSNVLALGVVEFLTRKHFFTKLQSQVSSIAATTASQMNGNLVETLRTPGDENTPAYKQVQAELRAARDANRRKDVYIKFLYILYPDPNDPHKFLFAVDAEEEGDDFSHLGTDAKAASIDKVYDRLNDVFANDSMTQDEWGVWLTGYAPIYNSSGGYAGTVGADISSDLVDRELDRLYLYAAIAFLLSFVEALIVVKFHADKVTRALGLLQDATQEVSKGNFKYRIQLSTQDEFDDLAKMMNRMNEGLEEKARLKSGFIHYLSQDALKKVAQTRGSLDLEGMRRKITVLFCDIRNFSRFADQLPPSEVIHFLNDYFEMMLDIVMKHEGMLDKLIGDAIIAEFGMAVDDPAQEKNALLTALEMHAAFEKFKTKWQRADNPTIEIGIGIHTGLSIVGSISTGERTQYTSVGETIAIATRLEGISKQGKHPIVASGETLQNLAGEFTTVSLEPLSIPDKQTPIQCFAIVSKKKIL